MHKHESRARARHGFTLVELLTVIAIIAVLASLITAAAQKVRITMLIAQAGEEIGQFAAAHQDFRLKYSLNNKGNYIPSKIRLREDILSYDVSNSNPAVAQFEALSYNWLGLWRPAMIQQGGYINWMGRDWSKDPIVGGVQQHTMYYDLEGDQCLVFFLGGIPVNGVPTGFARNVKNPASHVIVTPGGTPVVTVDQKQGTDQFYEFKLNRLINRGGVSSNNKVPWGFMSYADPLNGIKRVQVYAYFTSYGKANFYNNLDCQGMATTLGLSNCFPRVASANPPTYVNANSFQIMSADLKSGDFQLGSFGPGS